MSGFALLPDMEAADLWTIARPKVSLLHSSIIMQPARLHGHNSCMYQADELHIAPSADVLLLDHLLGTAEVWRLQVAAPAAAASVPLPVQTEVMFSSTSAVWSQSGGLRALGHTHLSNPGLAIVMLLTISSMHMHRLKLGPVAALLLWPKQSNKAAERLACRRRPLRSCKCMPGLRSTAAAAGGPAGDSPAVWTLCRHWHGSWSCGHAGRAGPARHAA